MHVIPRPRVGPAISALIGQAMPRTELNLAGLYCNIVRVTTRPSSYLYQRRRNGFETGGAEEVT